MTLMSKLNRRKLLKLGSAGSLIGYVGVLSACAPRQTAPATTSSTSTANNTAFVPDLEIALKAVAGETAILPGTRTRVWRYEAQVTMGEPNSVVTLSDNYLGPIIKVRTGQKVRVNFANALPEGQPTIVHWHGLILPEEMDGHPRYQIQPSQTYLYEFEVKNRAGTYWFHPHPHGLTSLQVNNGLAGLFLVSDEEEASAGLPSGEQDIPIIIQDRTFDANNQFVYNIAMNSMGGGMMGGGMMGGAMMGGGMMGGDMMSSVMGFLGERILVNGKPEYRLSVATRAYRLRLLNGSNSRIYKLAWSDGTPMTVIATDGGLLDKPAMRNFVMLAPGERVELWTDFSKRKVGDEFTLESQAFVSGETTMGNGGMGMGMTYGNAPGLGAGMTILSVRVERQVTETLKMPAQLSTIKRLSVDEAVNASSPRQFHLTLNGMQWLINGRTFEMNAVADDELVKIGTTEVWEFLNEKNPGQMMDPNGMPHPFHIHGVQFNMIERTALSNLQPMVDAVRDGYIDDGWKDTFLLMPGERVKVLMRFTNMGTFVFHCHNLEHEAQGMMRNYRVVV
jgi:FtsP/CotA-like multicopper oxidase with cupredoxin domain